MLDNNSILVRTPHGRVRITFTSATHCRAWNDPHEWNRPDFEPFTFNRVDYSLNADFELKDGAWRRLGDNLSAVSMRRVDGRDGPSFKTWLASADYLLALVARTATEHPGMLTKARLSFAAARVKRARTEVEQASAKLDSAHEELQAARIEHSHALTAAYPPDEPEPLPGSIAAFNAAREDAS